MPELPEVETIKNQLLNKIRDKKIKQVEVRLAKMVKGATVKAFKKILQGMIIKKVARRAKLLIIDISNGYSLIIHLKMSGQLIFSGGRASGARDFVHENIKTFTHIIYYFTDNSCLLHNDMRQFGYVRLIKTADLEKFFTEKGFGPEILSKSFTLKKFEQLLSHKTRSKIKPLLMNQSFIAGVGNIYAQEACWCAKILPIRLVKDLKEKEIKRLYNCLLKILKAAIKHKGTSTDTYLDVSGQEGEYSSRLKVYGRQNKKCLRCGRRIKKITLNGRGTCYCPGCQK